MTRLWLSDLIVQVVGQRNPATGNKRQDLVLTVGVEGRPLYLVWCSTTPVELDRVPVVAKNESAALMD